MRISKLVPALVLAGLASAWVPLTPAMAASKGSGGGGSHTSTNSSGSALGLTSETVQWNPKLSERSCLTEDDYDQRAFSGSLNGSYSTGYTLCDLNSDGLTAGGIGLQTVVGVVGQLSDLTITAPDGSVHHAVPTGQSTSRGVTTSYYEACYVPTYYTSTNTSSNPLPGGAWQITLSGQISSANWTTNAEMTNVTFQQNYCPASEQNLSS